MFPTTVREIAPSRHHSLSSSSRRPRRATNDLLDRLNAAETRTLRPRSHSRSLVRHADARGDDPRSLSSIQAEIAALETEARARKFSRSALAERDSPRDARGRERRGWDAGTEIETVDDEVVVVNDEGDEMKVYAPGRRGGRSDERSSFVEEVRSEEDRVGGPTDVVWLGRERSRNRWWIKDEVFITPEFREEPLYERRRSPDRNVVRVEKDRKGRMALRRSAR